MLNRDTYLIVDAVETHAVRVVDRLENRNLLFQRLFVEILPLLQKENDIIDFNVKCMTKSFVHFVCKLFPKTLSFFEATNDVTSVILVLS